MGEKKTPTQAPFASSNTVLSWTFLHLSSWLSLMTHQLSSPTYSSTFESWENQGVGCPPVEWGPRLSKNCLFGDFVQR